MYIQKLLSGEWLYFTGGSSLKSRKLRFVRSETGYKLEVMYLFDREDEVLLQFSISESEVNSLMTDLQKDSYFKLEVEKNDYPFLLELQLFPDGLELKLDGHAMAWPGHPQRFLMTEFERIELSAVDEE